MNSTTSTQANDWQQVRADGIPEGWTEVCLGEVLREVDLRASDVSDGISLPVLSLTKEHGLIPQEEKFRKRVAKKDVSGYKVVKPGWIVYNPYVIWEGAIHARTDSESGLISPAYVTWEAADADPEFLNFAFRTDELLRRISRLCAGAVNRRRSISKRDFRSVQISLPPLPEQRAIARVLRTVQRTKEATEQVIAAAREVKRSLMRHLFTFGPTAMDETNAVTIEETAYGPVPAAWAIVPLASVAFVQTGAAKGRKLNGDEAVAVPYLRVANVQDGHLDLSEMRHIRIRKSELERYSLQPGDVVLTEGGDFDKLGRGFIWRGEVPNCIHQNHVFAVRTDRHRLLPEYLAYFAQSENAKSYFLKVAHRTTNLACINSTKLKSLPVPLPDPDTQREIAVRLAVVDRKIEVEENRKATSDALFNSLLHHLMTGKVRVHDLPEVSDAPG